MAPIVWADVIAHATQVRGGNVFALIDPVEQADLLAMANTRVNIDVFDGEDGIDTRMARIYFAAHFAAGGTVQQRGEVISETRGKLSADFQAVAQGAAGDAGFWGTTPFGLKYYAMLQMSRARWMRVP